MTAERWRVEHDECLVALERMPAASVDAVVTDPPYGLSREPDVAEVLTHWLAGDDYAHRGGGFMGQTWDSFVPGPAIWREALRVLKPGGHLLAFGGTRTFDLLTTAVRLAGFEIRDRVLTLNGHVVGPELDWIYGTGWPKSLDVERTIACATCTLPGRHFPRRISTDDVQPDDHVCPPTPESEPWTGYGTALKPAHEPIVCARKPYMGTLVANVRANGAGALNIDGCRTAMDGEQLTHDGSDPARRRGVVGAELQAPSDAERNGAAQRESIDRTNRLGRWPANVVLLHAEGCASSDCAPGCPVAMLDHVAGDLRSGDPTAVGDPAGRSGQNAYMGESRAAGTPIVGYGDAGSASRFFYSGKTSPVEREAGLDGLPVAGRTDDNYGTMQTPQLDRAAPRENWTPREIRNTHPTVKPIDLMRWLIRLVVPAGALIVDPFAGSGTTVCAAALEGVRCVAIERDDGFVALARARATYWASWPVGTPTDRVLAHENERRGRIAKTTERRRDLDDAGQLDLLLGEGGPGHAG